MNHVSHDLLEKIAKKLRENSQRSQMANPDLAGSKVSTIEYFTKLPPLAGITAIPGKDGKDHLSEALPFAVESGVFRHEGNSRFQQATMDDRRPRLKKLPVKANKYSMDLV